jgi:lycopene cyclase domain-containing protein
MKYVLLNVVVLVALAVALCVARVRIPWRVAGWVVVAMLLLTLVFDNAIIGAGIVAYDPQFISGVKAWLAPIEDFAYTIAAVMVVALLWEREVSYANNS